MALNGVKWRYVALHGRLLALNCVYWRLKHCHRHVNLKRNIPNFLALSPRKTWKLHSKSHKTVGRGHGALARIDSSLQVTLASGLGLTVLYSAVGLGLTVLYSAVGLGLDLARVDR